VSEVGLIYRNIGLKIEFCGHRYTEMEVEQMFARLLNEMKANREKMEANQAKAEADKKGWKPKRKPTCRK
jgi:inhibitor of KinA sporulation pathway (predicted exonuclease)